MIIEIIVVIALCALVVSSTTREAIDAYKNKMYRYTTAFITIGVISVVWSTSLIIRLVVNG